MNPWHALGLIAAAFAAGALAGAWWREATAYRLCLVRLTRFNMDARRGTR
jgi:hypothetical protein